MATREVLPDNVKPVHYSLSIKDMDFENWTYQGLVTIESEVVKPTTEITLNTLELKLIDAKVTVQNTKAEQTWSSKNFSYDIKPQRATIAFAEEIPVSKKASLTIQYEGSINADMAGFYRSKYTPTIPATEGTPRDDDWHYMISTQFESSDARRAYPCFDEPNLKASFDLELEVPSTLVALSNMPVKETKASSRAGWKIVSFERTPIMSSYLLAWAIGDFEYIESFTERKYNGKQIPVRVYTTRGLKEQGRWALEHAPKTIDLFSEIFDIDYPLPKADLLAAHEFTHGAMENWGLVTYRTTRVLYDEKTASPSLKNDIAYVVAHELAHQWFGNLVTMDWWDELWLNEGFATWVGWYAVNRLHPEWNVWSQFVNQGMQNAFNLDSIRASHPIFVEVRDALDVNQIFDHISYLKGCSSIRMLANHLGSDTFLKGVSNYLKAHAYGNAKTVALWNALSEASGKNVTKLMDTWIGKIGHPVVTVTEQPGQITLKQSRFLSTGDVKPEDDTTTWWIPLGLEGKKGVSGVADLSMTEKEQTFDGIDDDFYKLNTDANAFFRVNYPTSRLTKLATQLDRLSAQDKISTIASAGALAFGGESGTDSLLTFVEGFGKETDTLVWSQVLDSLAAVKGVFGGDEAIAKGLNNLTNKLIDAKVKEIGWESSPDDSYLTVSLRQRLITSAINAGHPETLQEGIRRFNAWVQDPKANPIDPSLRKAVFRAGVFDNADANIDVLKKYWAKGESVDGKLIVLSALSAVKDVDAIKNKILTFLFNTKPLSDSVDVADMHFLSGPMAHNHVARGLLWDHIKTNWDSALAKMGNPIIVDRFVRVSLNAFTETEHIEEVEAFFQDKDVTSFNRSLDQAKDKSRGRAAYKKRDAAAIKEWLTANKYI